MSFFQATSKQKKADSNTFKSTKNKSYDSSTVYSWEQTNKSSSDALELYYNKINNKEYLTADDFVSFRKALDNYIDSTNRLRKLSKGLGNSFEDERDALLDDYEWYKTQTDLRNNFQLASEYYSKYDSENAYNQDQKAAEEWEKTKAKYDAYDADAGAAKIERLKYYSDRKKELEAIIAGPAVGDTPDELRASQGAKNKAIVDLQNLYAEYDKEFGAKKPTTIHGDPVNSSGSSLISDPLANGAPKVDFDKLLAEAETLYNDVEEYRLYNSIVADPNYQSFAEKVNNAPYIEPNLFQMAKDKKQNKFNRLKWAEQQKSDWGYDAEGITIYNKGDESNVLPMLMTNIEKTLYNWYFYELEDYDKAEEYYQSIKGELEERAHGTAQVNVYQQGKERPGFTSIQSVLRSVYGTPTEALMDTAKLVGDSLAGKEDVKLDRNQTSDLVSTARGSVSEDMSGFGKMLYNTTMSGADSFVSGLTFGKAGEFALALSAASSGVNDALDRGMSDKQAIANGIATGIFEYIFEKWSLGNLRAMQEATIQLGKGAIKDIGLNIAKSMAVNASEEALTEMANIFYDAIINGDKSHWQEKLDSGMTVGQAFGQSFLQVLEAAGSGALMGIGFGGAGSAMGAINAIDQTISSGKDYKTNHGQEAVGDLIGKGLEMNQSTAAYKQAQKLQGKLDKGKKTSNYSVGRLYSSMSEAQISTALQTRLTSEGVSETEARKLGNTVTDIIRGREVSNSNIAEVVKSSAARAVLNESIGAKIGASASVSDVKAAIKSYREVAKKPSPSPSSDGATSPKVGGVGGVKFSMQKNTDGGFDVVAEYDGERIVLNGHTFKSQKQAEAAVYAMTLGMRSEGMKGLVTISESLPEGVSLGDAALVFNAIYNQGKSGKAMSAVKNMNLLSLDQRQYAYQNGIVDGLLERSRSEKSSGEVLQKDADSDKINKNKESTKNEQGVHIREGGKRNDGEDPGGQVSGMESRSGEAEEQGSGSSQEARAARIRALVKSKGLKKVSSRSLGIGSGTETENVVVIPESEYDDGMRQIAEDQAAQGRKVIFVSGALEFVEDGKTDVAQGLISEDGKTMWIQADGAISPEQIALHEEYHAIVKADPSIVDRMKKKINKKYKGKLNVLVKMYAALYFTDDNGKVTVTTEYILEEIFADAYAGIDVFEVISDAAARATDIQEDIRGGAKALQSTRAPPSNSEVKASRKNRELYTSTDNFYREVSWADRSAFSRSLAYKTNGMVEGEIRVVTIYASNIYLFKADGYMHGEMIPIPQSDDLKTLKSFIEGKKNEYERTEKAIDKWAGDERNARIFNGGANSLSIGNGGRNGSSNRIKERSGAEGADNLYDEQSQRNSTGDNEQSRGNNYSKQEIDILVETLIKSVNHIDESVGGNSSKLAGQNIDLDTQEGWNAAKEAIMELYNEDNGDIKASRSLRSPEDVARAYLDAVPNRLILANAIESQVTDQKAKELLQKYKNNLSNIEVNQAELNKTKAELHKLYFAKGKRNVEKIKTLEHRRDRLQKIIDNADKWLLKYEEMKPIRDLIDREKTAAYKKAAAEGKRKLEEYRERVKAREEEIRKGYREARERGVEIRHKTEIRHKIKGVVAELDKVLRKGNKQNNVKIGLQDAVASALEAFDVNADKVERYNKEIADLDARIAAANDSIEIEALTVLREKKQQNSDRLADKLHAMKKAYEDIHNSRSNENYPQYYNAEAEVIENRIAEVIEKVGDTPISEMSIEQLETVYDMYRMVLATVRNVNKVFKNGKLEDLTKDASTMTSELQKIKKLPGERLKVGDKVRGYAWNELTPYYAFSHVGSKTFISYYWDIVLGQNVYARDIYEANEFAKATRTKHGYSKWKLDQVRTFKSADGRDFRLTLRHMMSIYAYSKREQALDHMEKGGFFFNDKETFRKKGGVLELIASNEFGYKVDASVLGEIKNALTTEQIAYVDEMQDYLTAMGDKGNEVTRKMWGIDIFTEKVYFPLKSKEDFIYQANTPAETSSLKNDGMTKETKPHASNPIVLEAFDDVWANHVNKMSMYHGFVIPIDNLNKLINYGTWIDGDAQSISTMLESRYGSGANDYFTTFIKDLNGAKAQSGGILDGAFNLLTKFKKTKVAASLSVAVQQPMAILRACSEIDVKYFIGLPKPVSLSKRWELIQKYAPIAIIKDIGGFDAGSGRTVTEWLRADTKRGLDKAMSKADDLMMYGAALGDRLGWGSIWVACEREVGATQDLTPGTKEFYEAVGERFTEVIVKTQVYDSTLSRSGFMRGKDGLMKMATAFMGEPTLSINMLQNAVIEAKRHTISKKQAVRTIAAVYASIIAANAAKSLIYALRDDDEDESYVEKYMQALGGSIITDINPLSMLPFIKDVTSILLEGWDVDRSDMELIKDLKNAITATSGETKDPWRKVEDLAGATAAFFGVPLKNVMRTMRELWNVYENITDGIEGGDLSGAFSKGVRSSLSGGVLKPFLKDWSWGQEANKSELMYNAIVSGDPDRVAVFKKTYDTEEKYFTAVKRALRDYDPRVQKAVEGALSGDYGIYNDAKNAVSAEKHFDAKTVNNAFADEREYVLGKLSDARKARRQGNSEEYEKIIDSLLDRGYSEEFIKRKLK